MEYNNKVKELYPMYKQNDDYSKSYNDAKNTLNDIKFELKMLEDIEEGKEKNQTQYINRLLNRLKELNIKIKEYKKNEMNLENKNQGAIGMYNDAKNIYNYKKTELIFYSLGIIITTSIIWMT